jgi:hypothetical protein
MARKRKGMVAAAAAFAASPQGRRMLQQAKAYASRPENQEKAKQLLQRAKSRGSSKSTAPARPDAGQNGAYGAPVYGTPSRTTQP